MADEPLKRSRNKASTPDKAKNLCVVFKQKVTADDDAVECQWCE